MARYASSMANKPKRPRDVNQLAAFVVKIATEGKPPEEPDTRNPAAVAMSMLGASKGGHARAAKMSKTQRVKSAKLAAKARWSKGHRDG